MGKRDHRQLLITALDRIPLLASMPSERRHALAERMKLNSYPKNAVVISKGDRCDGIMFLIEGSLQVVDYSEDGREIGLNFFQPGEFFGELALIDGLPRSACVLAMEPSQVAILPKEYALPLITQTPAVAEAMLKHLTRVIRDLTEMRAILSMPSSRQRLLAWLVRMTRVASSRECAVIELPSHRQVAIMINASRETVSRVLAELERRAILEKRRHRLIIRRLDELERLARERAD